VTTQNGRLPAGPHRSQKGLERLGEGRNARMVTRCLADLAHTLGCAEELATTLAQDGIPAPAVLQDRLRLVVREELARLTATARTAGFVDVPAAAAHAGVTPATIREWVSRGLLPAARAGRRLRVRLADVEGCLVQQARGPEKVNLDDEAARIVALDRARQR